MKSGFFNTINRTAFTCGMHDGIPIGLCYLAVSFSLGIAAKNAGLTAVQSFLASLFCVASAGEYAGFTVIAAKGAIIEIILMTLVANARYLLMSCAMSQRMNPKTGMKHRFFMSLHITDELFAIAIARPGYLNPYYSYGGALTAVPCWAVGTALGTIAGNVLPPKITSALSVALYGMFLAVIIPSAKKDKIIAGIIIVCFALSFAVTYLPFFAKISSGVKIIVLTVVISSVAAIIFPKKAEDPENAEESGETGGAV